MERSHKCRERNDDRRGIALANDIEQFLVFLQVTLHAVWAVVGAVVDEDVIGTLMCNGRAVEIADILKFYYLCPRLFEGCFLPLLLKRIY